MYAQPQSLLPNFISGNADRLLHATMGKWTGGLSPAALSSAWLDWAMHLAISPSKQAEIVEMGVRQWERLGHLLMHAQDGTCEHCIEPLPQDPRFRDPAWDQWPYSRGLPELPAGPAVAVDLHARRARRDPAPRAGDGLHHAPGDGLLLALQLPVQQSRGDEDHPGDQRREPGPGLAQLAGGHGAHDPRRAAGRGGELRGREEPRGHARQGGAEERADRADPVHADDGARARRARPHGAGVDHEVLHPRPVAAELAGEVPGGQGAHGLHDLVEEPGAGGPQPFDGRLPAQAA